MLLKTIIFFIALMITVSAGDNKRPINSKGTLIIKFTGLSSDKGNVKIALANSKLNYDDHKNPYIGLTAKVNQKSAVTVVENIPLGEYAVKAFHDEDANDDLNTNFLGIPIEDYGFSNNARAMFGPPSWNDAKFILDRDTLTVEVTIK